MTNIAPILVVSSVEKSLIWYREILGFDALVVTTHEGGDAYYAVLSGNVGFIHLGREIEMEQDCGNGGFEMATSDFDKIHKLATNSTTEFYFDISINPAGDENFAILDPDKNRIIVARS